jgi:hypothetical protein
MLQVRRRLDRGGAHLVVLSFGPIQESLPALVVKMSIPNLLAR